MQVTVLGTGGTIASTAGDEAAGPHPFTAAAKNSASTSDDAKSAGGRSPSSQT